MTQYEAEIGKSVGFEVRKVLYEGEGFRVVEVAKPINSPPFFQAYGMDGKEDFHCFANHTLADLMHNLRKNKPEWAREIDLAGD